MAHNSEDYSIARRQRLDVKAQDRQPAVEHDARQSPSLDREADQGAALEVQETGRIEHGRVRVKEAIEQMRTSEHRDVEEETTYYPHVGFLADGDSIADQQVDVIEAPHETAVSFKFTKRKAREVIRRLGELLNQQERGEGSLPITIIERGFIEYKDPKNYGDLRLSAAFVIKRDGLEVQVAAGVSRWEDFHKTLGENADEADVFPIRMRVSLGLVRIVGRGEHSPEELSSKVNAIVERYCI